MINYESSRRDRRSLKKHKIIVEKAEKAYNKFSDKSNLKNGKFTNKDIFLLAFTLGYKMFKQDQSDSLARIEKYLNIKK